VAYPRRLLQEDEQIVLDLHPHWRRVFFPVLSIPVVVAIAAFAVTQLPSGSSHTWEALAIVGAALLVLIFTFVRPWLRWVTTSYVVTTHRVVLRNGILSRSGRDVPLSRINDVTFEHGVVERILRSGTLIVESAGERGQVTLADVPRVEEVQRAVYRLVEEDDERRRGHGRDLRDADGTSDQTQDRSFDG
jgi:uncharacterized membrane protein YdbT with pleckstrin-like domain